VIECLLLVRQLLPLGFLEGRLDRHARHLLLLARLSVADRDQRYVLGQTLIAFIRVGLTPVGQPLHGLELITQFLVMRGPGHGHADSLDVMLSIRDQLGLEREGFLFESPLRASHSVSTNLQRIHESRGGQHSWTGALHRMCSMTIR
jgi:hypothetical protein